MNITPDTSPVGFEAAIDRLAEGNRRFVQDVRSIASFASSAERRALAAAQSPFAIILSCSDSRVPAEMVFDQGLGSLFVVRVAGNVVAPSLVGSIEYAVHAFGAQLVVVMGHTSCGAVKATIEHLHHLQRPSGHVAVKGHADHDDDHACEHVLDLVERIKPAVAPLVSTIADEKELLVQATRANIRASVTQLRNSSRLLQQRTQRGELLVVGAEYSLETGVVEMFDRSVVASDAHRAA